MVDGTQPIKFGNIMQNIQFRIKIGIYDIQFEDHIDTGRVTLDHRQEVHVTYIFYKLFI